MSTPIRRGAGARSRRAPGRVERGLRPPTRRRRTTLAERPLTQGSPRLRRSHGVARPFFPPLAVPPRAPRGRAFNPTTARARAGRPRLPGNVARARRRVFGLSGLPPLARPRSSSCSSPAPCRGLPGAPAARRTRRARSPAARRPQRRPLRRRRSPVAFVPASADRSATSSPQRSLRSRIIWRRAPRSDRRRCPRGGDVCRPVRTNRGLWGIAVWAPHFWPPRSRDGRAVGVFPFNSVCRRDSRCRCSRADALGQPR
jgi:hypothetical protein